MKAPTRSFIGAARGLLFSALAVITLQAADVPAPNSAFDANANGWTRETWAVDGAVSWDANQNSTFVGGSPTSGSLKLVSNFVAQEGYQQGVYTIQFNPPVDFQNKIGTISFDVKVDSASSARPAGNYGWLEVILRQGADWVWTALPGVSLTSTEWQRVSFNVPAEGVDSIRAMHIKVGDPNFTGPVTIYVDNISYWTDPDHRLITAVDNGTADSPVQGWAHETWSVNGTALYDPVDTAGRSTSGTLELTHNFADLAGYQQSVFTFVLPGGAVNGSRDYGYINMDIRVDPASVKRAAGDYGFLEVFMRNGTGWTWVPTKLTNSTGLRITDNEWRRVSFKVDPTLEATNVHRITTKLGDNGMRGPVILNIDNVTWTRTLEEPDPPKLSIKPAIGGLTVTATDTDRYGRHNFYTSDALGDPTALNFHGSTEPVSYSITLDAFPSRPDYTNFQAHIFLVPGAPGTERSPDWNQPTLIYFEIKSHTNGGGIALFRYKTDQPGDNTELYGASAKTNVVSATMLGKWTVTHVGNGVFTMTGPDGTVSSPIDIGAEAYALFEGNMRVYFGIQANDAPNIGQSARIGAVEIKKGATVLLEDNFEGTEFDLNKWTLNAPDGAISYVQPSDAGYVIRWTLPDTGFQLKMTADLNEPQTWTDVTAPSVQIGGEREVKVPKSALPAGDKGFFMLYKPAPEPPAEQ